MSDLLSRLILMTSQSKPLTERITRGLRVEFQNRILPVAGLNILLGRWLLKNGAALKKRTMLAQVRSGRGVLIKKQLSQF
jgi:hypothetical protein